MNTPSANFVTCGEREASVPCERCRKELRFGERAAICHKCGAVHHADCWANSGCCSYECQGRSADPTGPVIKIDQSELEAVVPLPPSTSRSTYQPRALPDPIWNRTAVWAFGLALAGIPLFGVLTGLIAIVVACIALVTHNARYKGLGFGVAAILIGFVDVIGWSVGLAYYFGDPQAMVALEDLTADVAAINAAEEPLRRALRANVLIQTGSGFQSGLGSGVILKMQAQRAWIVTNRHVVDMDYADGKTNIPDFGSLDELTVQAVGQAAVPARVEWIAPHGVDLAMISAALNSESISEAFWDATRSPRIGEDVFAVGNPHGFGWTHSTGGISQLRKRHAQTFEYSVLQTSTPLNPGNSGGGLYSSDGLLLGINSLTGDKRIAEGLGFSIALQTLWDLLPDRFEIPDRNVEETQE